MTQFDEWWEELLVYAAEKYPLQYKLIANAPFMYEDYWQMGLTVQDALVSEWGE